ncbi:hypothetical protein JKP88DRAFT_304149 [Tribonema minus]|uniref:Uncharacterized protein n=1 Tax=Tribonema minus TaxID=303371 RepID=A0A835Z864_9STRA|nr:hypothetical protein JKP88DRAFT_304149 [Tribonema minus]
MLQHANVLATHAPCDDAGRPAERLRVALSPASLLSTAGLPRDAPIPFAAWLRLLLSIATTVYARVAALRATRALDATLHELIVPLHAWRCVHRGAACAFDTVQTSLLHAYGPNLWRLYLTYATTGPHARPAPVTLPYPAAAAAAERAAASATMPGLWPVYLTTPEHDEGLPEEQMRAVGTLTLPQKQLLRLAYDFNVMPDVIGRAALLSMVADTLGRRAHKRPAHTPGPDDLLNELASMEDEDEVGGLEYGTPRPVGRATTASVARGGSARTPPARPACLRAGDAAPAPPQHRRVQSPLHARSKSQARQAAARVAPQRFATPASVTSEQRKGAAVLARGGLGYCEFVELLARVAVEGLQHRDTLHTLYPTPYAKVAALLSVWGLADPNRLEEVALLRTRTFENATAH